jgi:hypothetical protein
LGELGTAVYRADEDPRLVLWLELLTVAHITGRRAPDPDPAWIASLNATYDERTLECAVAHRIQTAVDARYAGITAYNPAGEFISHLASSARRTLAGEPHPCDGTEVRWQAGRYRWLDVLRALKAAGPDVGPHPSTAEWAARGLDLDGSTRADQLATLRLRPEQWRNDDPTVLGTTEPISIVSAFGRLSNAKTQVKQFDAATQFLHLRFRADQVLHLNTESR